MTTQLHEAQARTVRLTAEKGEPALLFSTTSIYAWIYNDRGSGAHQDVTIWRPTPTSSDWSIVGDYAQGNYNNPNGSSVIVKAINDDPAQPILKAPVGFNEIWNDHGSGGDNDGSIWFPVAPDGYVAMGAVAASGYSPPTIPSLMCVRRDFLQATTVGNEIWSDQGSGAHMDVTLYTIVNVSGVFAAQGNYSPFSGTVLQFKTS